MKKSIALILTILSVFILFACNSTTNVNYPKKPITWIVPFGTGGGSDQFARMMEKQIESISNIEIVVVNKPGSKTAVGFNELMKKPADGYTLYGATTDSVINMVTSTTKNSLEDIIPIAKIQHNVDMWFIKNDDKRFNSFDSLVKYAKTHPGELSIATTGLNGADAISIKKIEEKENIDLKIVPFSEPGERYAALAGGHVDILHEQPGDVLSFIKSETYKPVIAMTETRVEGFEDVPTTVEKGLNVTSGYWRGIWMKKGVGKKKIEMLEKVIKKAVETEEYKKYEKRKYLHLRKGFLVGEKFGEFLDKEFKHYKEALSK